MQTFLTDLRHGRFELIRGDMISEIADYYGEWSDVEVHIFKFLLEQGSNVIEVGANLGLHAVPIAQYINRLPPPHYLCENTGFVRQINLF